MNTVLGIDEAGRGPVLGPMILAGVLVSSEIEEELKKWGVDDSKKFGSSKVGKKKRAELAEKIQNCCPHSIQVLPPNLIDQYVKDRRLNILEQETAQKIIEEIEHSYQVDRVILDGQRIFQPLIRNKIQAFAKADQQYVSVGAASILAKNTRDLLFQEFCNDLANEFGAIQGGGYPNQATFRFVQQYYKAYKKLPDCYRKQYQWKSVRQLITEAL